MTRVPGPVKALGAVGAFLTLSYAVSVWAAPRSGIEDLGTGGPEAVSGAYGRDPAPPVTWWRVGRSPSVDGQVVQARGEGGPVGRSRVAAPPLTPVSARTVSVDAAPKVVAAQGAPAIATPEPAAPVATSPPPVRPSQGGKDPSAEPPGNGSSGNGSSGGSGRPRHHQHHHDSGSGCGGGSRATASRGVPRGPAPTPAAPRKPVAQPHRRGR